MFYEMKPEEDASGNNSSSMLTEEQLAKLGGGYVAYVKPMRSEDVTRLFPQAPPLAPGLQVFALLAADGSPIMLTDTREMAVANAMQNSLYTVSLH